MLSNGEANRQDQFPARHQKYEVHLLQYILVCLVDYLSIMRHPLDESKDSPTSYNSLKEYPVDY